MNTCARLESTSLRGRIHASKETAQLLRKAGREDWLEKRDDMTEIKGKGCFETYFINVDGGVKDVSLSNLSHYEPSDLTSRWDPLPGIDEKTNRLIDWNVEELLKLLKLVISNRCEHKGSKKLDKAPSSSALQMNQTPFDEVVEIISLPEEVQHCAVVSPDEVEIPSDVIIELHLLVSNIAQMYNDNPFHNFGKLP